MTAAASAKYRATHKEQVREYQRAYRAKNPDLWKKYYARYTNARTRAENIEYQKAYRAANPGLHRKYQLRDRYGISPADYDTLLTKQRGVCAICGKQPARALNVDHDHRTGAVRGLLCTRCNTGLARVEDRGFVAAAMNYLASFISQAS